MLPLLSQLKKAALIAIVVMAILLIGAFVFYRQRIFSDSAFILFNIINYDALQIQESRYGSFITQVVPLVLARLHLPMKAIIISYSASFYLFYLGTAVLLFRFKEYALVLLMAMYYTLYCSDAYFWPNCELHQGVCWMFLAFGVLRYLSSKAGQHGRLYNIMTGILFSIFSWLAIYSHPTVIIPFIFLWIFFWLVQDSAPFNKRHSIFYFLIILAISFSKYLQSTKSTYDSNNFKGIQHISVSSILETFTSSMADHFWQSILHNYWLLPLILISTIVILLRRRKYLLLSWVLLANLGFFIILCLTFRELSITFHYESEFMPFGILCGAAFIWYVIPSLQKPKIMMAVIAGIFLVRLTYISIAAPKFIARARTMTHVLDYMKGRGVKKAIIASGDGGKLNDAMILTWALPYESVLYSNLEGDKWMSTFSSKTDNELHQPIQILHPTTDFCTPWGYIDGKELKAPYLRIDTLQFYKIIPFSEATGL